MFTICPCCGFESGFHDDAKHEPVSINEYRIGWIKSGAPWLSSSNPKKPEDFDLKNQLEKIGINNKGII